MEPPSSADTSDAPKPGRDELLKIYDYICTNIRISDDISFKLLGLVPAISAGGSATLELLKFRGAMPGGAVSLIALSLAVITFGLYIWERRNIQKCEWLIDRAAAIERKLGMPCGQFDGWKELRKLHVPTRFVATKTQGESIIYFASMFAWLVPVVTVIVTW